MGRGSSKAGAGSSTRSVTQATVQNGTLINLPAPLVYGGKDAALTGANRTAIDQFEQSKKQSRVENTYCLDANGNLLEAKRGGRHSCNVSDYALDNSEVISHNHPRGAHEYILGGTFSDADIKLFCDGKNLQTMRASASEGTYSISRAANFNARGFRSFYINEVSRARSTYQTATHFIQGQLNTGAINGRTAKRRNEGAMNRMMIDLHNTLIANQSRFGYTYTLE